MALAAIDAAGQAIVLRRLHLIRSRIVETLQQKLQFLYTIPYRAIGIFWCEHGGTLEVCKQIARECMNEYDEAIRNNLVVHRVAHFLFHPSTPCRIEMQLWVDSVLPLRAFLALFRQLLEYALSPFSERSIESVHAIIKRIGRQATHCHPPTLVARMRSNQTLDLLQQCADFKRFVIANLAV